MGDRDETSTCRTCGGPIYRHAWGSGQGWGAWMHVSVDHRAVPLPTITAIIRGESQPVSGP